MKPQIYCWHWTIFIYILSRRGSLTIVVTNLPVFDWEEKKAEEEEEEEEEEEGP